MSPVAREFLGRTRDQWADNEDMKKARGLAFGFQLLLYLLKHPDEDLGTIIAKYEKRPAEPAPTAPEVPVSMSDVLVAQLRFLSDEERLELFSNFCRSCGSDDPKCNCANYD